MSTSSLQLMLFYRLNGILMYVFIDRFLSIINMWNRKVGKCLQLWTLQLEQRSLMFKKATRWDDGLMC